MSSAQASATNPYTPHCCVTDPQDLYGRDSDLVKLAIWVEKQRRSPAVLPTIGGYKVGKSSVLKCFRKEPKTEKENVIIAYCDLSKDDLASQLKEEIEEQSSSLSIPSTITVSFNAKEWIQAIGNKDKELYVLLDNYERFLDSAGSEDKENLFERLTEWLKEPACGGYTFATRLYKKDELCALIMKLKALVVFDMPVSRIMEPEHENLELLLDLLEREEARKLIRREKNQGISCPFRDSDVRFILKQAGCHPHWLQSLCDCLHKEYQQCNLVPPVPGSLHRLRKRRAIQQCRQKALQKVRQKHLNAAFNRIWDRHLGSGTLRDTLIEIARNPGINYQEKGKAFIHDVEQLRREGLVEEEGGRVAITGKLFEAFVCEQEKDPNQRRWYEPCSPFRQRFDWLFSQWFRYALAVPAGLVVISLWLLDNVIGEALWDFLKPVRERVEAVVMPILPVWPWIPVLIVIVFVIVFIVGIITLSRRSS